MGPRHRREGTCSAQYFLKFNIAAMGVAGKEWIKNGLCSIELLNSGVALTKRCFLNNNVIQKNRLLQQYPCELCTFLRVRDRISICLNQSGLSSSRLRQITKLSVHYLYRSAVCTLHSVHTAINTVISLPITNRTWPNRDVIIWVNGGLRALHIWNASACLPRTTGWMTSFTFSLKW